MDPRSIAGAIIFGLMLPYTGAVICCCVFLFFGTIKSSKDLISTAAMVVLLVGCVLFDVTIWNVCKVWHMDINQRYMFVGCGSTFALASIVLFLDFKGERKKPFRRLY